MEPCAREIFPIGARKDAAPWLGRRPCLPDMRPVMGRARVTRACGSISATTIWASRWDPSAGRLLAELMTGEAPFTDPAPYRADRFS